MDLLSFDFGVFLGVGLFLFVATFLIDGDICDNYRHYHIAIVLFAAALTMALLVVPAAVFTYIRG